MEQPDITANDTKNITNSINRSRGKESLTNCKDSKNVVYDIVNVFRKVKGWSALQYALHDFKKSAALHVVVMLIDFSSTNSVTSKSNRLCGLRQEEVHVRISRHHAGYEL